MNAQDILKILYDSGLQNEVLLAEEGDTNRDIIMGVCVGLRKDKLINLKYNDQSFYFDGKSTLVRPKVVASITASGMKYYKDIYLSDDGSKKSINIQGNNNIFQSVQSGKARDIKNEIKHPTENPKKNISNGELIMIFIGIATIIVMIILG